MGYESAIPPLPTRAEELDMINRYQQEFIDQPSYKFYMNEGHFLLIFLSSGFFLGFKHF